MKKTTIVHLNLKENPENWQKSSTRENQNKLSNQQLKRELLSQLITT